MKRIFSIFIIFFCSLLGAKTNSYSLNLVQVQTPQSWKTSKTLMTSLNGYYLHSTINKKKHRFFIHSHKPSAAATKSGSERFFKEYIKTRDKNADYSCEKNKEYMSYHCVSIYKKNNKWSFDMMFWFQNKERLFLSLNNLSSKGEAQEIFRQLKVSVP